ncbi:MAG: exopolysaccharide biosynthesis protein [Methanobacterium sp.]
MSEKVVGEEKFSVVLSEISSKIPDDDITLEDFLKITGERGLFMSCMILTAPFLLPVSIPGSSIPFGSAIFLISSDIIFKRPILIPKRVMNYKVSKHDMESILHGISRVLKPIEEKIITPRLCFLTSGRKMEIINGIAVAFGAVLLVTPIIAIAGDFFPSYGILFISLGNLENDGFLVLAGYITVIATAIYYALIFAVGIGIIIFIVSYLSAHL